MTTDKYQQKFINDVIDQSKGHVILTGDAGTGKTFALVRAIEKLHKIGANVLVCAPTAIAASLHRDAGIKSTTIHSMLQWNPGKTSIEKILRSCSNRLMDWKTPPDPNRYLVIDEASMIGMWVFEVCARQLGDWSDPRPFEGRRVILVGDWGQLPPVVGSDAENAGDDIKRMYGKPDMSIFVSPLFTKNPPAVHILKESYRAVNEWENTLNAIRNTKKRTPVGSFNLKAISRRDDRALVLAYRNSVVHQINTDKLAMLPGNPHFLRLWHGDGVLKEECEIIVMSNLACREVFNGDRGVFQGIDRDKKLVFIRNRDGMRFCLDLVCTGNWAGIDVDKLKWKDTTKNIEDARLGREYARRTLDKWGIALESYGSGFLRAALTNDSIAAGLGDGWLKCSPCYAVAPGYATTVHKAQGQTLDSIFVTPDVFWRIAPEAMPYVALSRVRNFQDATLDALCLTERIRPNPILDFTMKRLESWL